MNYGAFYSIRRFSRLFTYVFLCILPLIALSRPVIPPPTSSAESTFELVRANQAATIYYGTTDAKLVGIAARLFAQDIKRVTSQEAKTTTSLAALKGNVVIIGTLGQSEVIDQLALRHKELGQLKGTWERYVIKTVANPFPGIDKALVIAGSDRRGTAYGVLSLSEEIGVSPWYWWADVPVPHQKELLLHKAAYVSKGPSVKYRGIFINDEAPALRNWATEKFGGFNHQFYEKVFELLLRNKANYLWPAMWLPRAFAADDPDNARLADEYGIVISTSHHEPMMRAHHEWTRFGGGAWNYETNKAKLQEFWRGGVERMGSYESVVTVGMRGDGDEAMSAGTAVGLLQSIIHDQRQILADVTGKPASATPQVWALYKEVQDYYDKGMRVPDDITVLFSDDNWGNLRILPKKEAAAPKGGYGMYYHLDYVGAPVSYRWLNVTQLERIWEQMNLTYAAGVKNLWIANVGDIKPMELPMSFFLAMAWDADAFTASNLPAYYVRWAEQQFGATYAPEIAEILALYTKYNARRTPEMLQPDTYSLDNYREADNITAAYQQLLTKSQRLYQQLPKPYQAAFYQLVLSPVAMSSNLNDLYVAAGKNQAYASQGRASANEYAQTVRTLFDKDAALADYYQRTLEAGKWDHMMSQTHLGYTHWNHPPADKTPPVSYIHPLAPATLGYQLEYGTAPAWRGFSVEGDGLYSDSFAPFDPVNDQHYYLELYNRGLEKMSYQLTPKQPWIRLSAAQGTIQFDQKVYVSIDWTQAPAGDAVGELVIAGAGKQYTVKVPLRRTLPKAAGFVENNGVVAIEATHFTTKLDARDSKWTVVPNLGRTGSALTLLPATAERQTLTKDTPHVDYTFTVFTGGDLKVETYVSPTQDFKKKDGLKYAIAIDGETPQVINTNEGEAQPDWQYPAWWNASVADHIKKKRSVHQAIAPGTHTLRVWGLDAGVVFQRFVLDAGGLKPSYLGPPESLLVQPN